MDVPQPDIRWSFATRDVNAYYGFLSSANPTWPTTASQSEQIFVNGFFDGVSSVWKHNNGTVGYTASNGFSGGGRTPTDSGYPSNIQDPNGNGIPLQANATAGHFLEFGPTWAFPSARSPYTATVADEGTTGVPPNYAYDEERITTVSSATNLAGIGSSSISDFTSRSWPLNWSSPTFAGGWNDAPFSTGLNPASYNGLYFDNSPYGGTGNPDIVLSPGGSPGTYGVGSGWSYAGGPGGLTLSMWRGQMRYLPAIPIFCMTIRHRNGGQFATASGEWTDRWEYISGQWITGPIILEAPFPATNPFPPSALSSGFVNQDFYFLVLGFDTPSLIGTIYQLGDSFLP